MLLNSGSTPGFQSPLDHMEFQTAAGLFSSLPGPLGDTLVQLGTADNLTQAFPSFVGPQLIDSVGSSLPPKLTDRPGKVEDGYVGHITNVLQRDEQATSAGEEPSEDLPKFVPCFGPFKAAVNKSPRP
jgi:hypothetical protein